MNYELRGFEPVDFGDAICHTVLLVCLPLMFLACRIHASPVVHLVTPEEGAAGIAAAVTAAAMRAATADGGGVTGVGVAAVVVTTNLSMSLWWMGDGGGRVFFGAMLPDWENGLNSRWVWAWWNAYIKPAECSHLDYVTCQCPVALWHAWKVCLQVWLQYISLLCWDVSPFCSFFGQILSVIWCLFLIPELLLQHLTKQSILSFPTGK